MNTNASIANFLNAIQTANNLQPHSEDMQESLVKTCRLMLEDYAVERESRVELADLKYSPDYTPFAEE
ncbi:MAG: hypothetical protein HRT37_26690 [Alteromonadaceae bacterium]|nr:hypothetical protein [Alteromonadaceae bacterium]